MTVLEEMIKKSGIDILRSMMFHEITPGRYFQKDKIEFGNFCQFVVVIGPNIESPLHNHSGQNITESHMLLYGSGKFLVYENASVREVVLSQYKFHEPFTTPDHCPDHKYIAGPAGSITVAFERKHSTK